MYGDRKGGGSGKLSSLKSPTASERSSPAAQRDSPTANGGFSGGSLASGLSKFGSFGGRLGSAAVASRSNGPSTTSGAQDRPVNGKAGTSSTGGSSSPSLARGSTPGEFKSASFNASSSSSLFSAAGSRGSLVDRASAGGRGRTPAALDLASLPRRTVQSFRSTAPVYTSPALGMSMSKARTTQQQVPTEYTYVLDDVTLMYGHSSFQGARDYQEDTVAHVASQAGLAAGVFDGHGGDEVSKELERVLLQNINRKVADTVTRAPNDLPAVQAAIHHAYVSTNEEIGMRMDAAMEAGSCAVTIFVTRIGSKPYLFCANAGDCRAVLCSQLPNGTRRAIRLSEDHKPQPNVCPSEITRINDAGGCVLWGRVQGCLAVSRAFGDRTLQPFVIADPHVQARELDPDVDSFFYLASDGVTDMVDDMTGCNIIADQFARGNNTTQAAAALVSAAYQKGSCDNISVLVVRLRRRQPGDVAAIPNGGVGGTGS